MRAIALNPGYAEALLALASVCERDGDFDRSRELAERAAADRSGWDPIRAAVKASIQLSALGWSRAFSRSRIDSSARLYSP